MTGVATVAAEQNMVPLAFPEETAETTGKQRLFLFAMPMQFVVLTTSCTPWEEVQAWKECFSGAYTEHSIIPPADTATDESALSPGTAARIHHALVSARGEEFEDGVKSALWTALENAVLEDGDAAMAEIGRAICLEPSDEVVLETLRCLGYLDDEPTRNSRFRLLLRHLRAPSLYARDGACLGLLAMKDARAIPYFKKRLQEETCPELREDIRRGLEYIRRQQSGTAIEGEQQ